MPSFVSSSDMVIDHLEKGKLVIEDCDRYDDVGMKRSDFRWRLTEDASVRHFHGVAVDVLLEMLKDDKAGNSACALMSTDVSVVTNPIYPTHPVSSQARTSKPSHAWSFMEVTLEFSVTDDYLANMKAGTFQPPSHTIVSGGYARVHGKSAFAQQMALLGQALGITSQPIIHFPEERPSLPPKIEDKGLLVEPLVGYRDFRIEWEGNHVDLLSRNGEQWYPREELHAICWSGQSGQQFDHDAPSATCDCGIYAFMSPNHKDMQVSQSIVWGEVNLWGEVLICDTGYRAEIAYPKNLFVLDNGTRIRGKIRDSLERDFGIPVYLVDVREPITANELIDRALSQLTEGGENK